MIYRNYGKLGYDVSLLGMGCMRLPRIYDGSETAQVDREKAYEMIRYAAEHGINYFDTALAYHNMDSEAVLGEALDGGLRERVKIATKQPYVNMVPNGGPRKNLEATLKKLRTDFIDVYLVHNIMAKDWEGIKRDRIFEQFEKFREEGLIGAVGFSIHGNFPHFVEVLNEYPWEMCQVQQNLFDVDKEVTEGAIRLAGEKGCALVVMEPLRGGGLANAPSNVRKIYEESGYDRTPAEWAFRHVANYPEVHCILSGMSNMEQLKQNIATFSQPDMLPGSLSDAEKKVLAAAKAGYEEMAAIACTGCEYCVPCPHDVNIPRTFATYNAGIMFEDFDQPRRNYMFQTRNGQAASNCIACGICETKCPQELEIINLLAMAHEKLAGWVE
jgi:predicted aldo/keto reductase-like oxidoreductase